VQQPQGLAEVGCLYLPDPQLGRFAWLRRQGDQRAYSLCGVTHTTATAASMDAVADLLTAPVQPWDALICTSRAVLATVQTVLAAQAEYLRARLGATRLVMPRLTVIPLGVDTDAYAPDPAKRATWRQRLGIGSEEIAVLFVGRLSFHAKAHPLPMYLGLEMTARRTGKKLHLILAGWFANDAIAAAFREEAARHCPSVRVHFLDGRTPEVRSGIWQAADLFTSLADNVQETFGLTPLEAMAAGLPVVVSDWDGYRDTVRHGVDGLRVPTLMPPPPLGGDLINRYTAGIDSYDRYCGHTSQFVAVDPLAFAVACIQLVVDAGLRARMGASGRGWVRTTFDWQVVVGQYRQLWAELAEVRRSAPQSAPRPVDAPAHPARQDPFRAFAGYPTRRLDGTVRFALGPGASAARLRELRSSPMVEFVGPFVPPPADCEAVVAHLARTRQASTEELLALVPTERRALLARGLVWMHKLGVLHALPPAVP